MGNATTTLRYFHVPGPAEPDEPTRLIATIVASSLREAFARLKAEHPEADPKRTDVESWIRTIRAGEEEYYQRPYPGCA